MIFEQQNQKKFQENLFFQRKTKFVKEKFWKKEFDKKIQRQVTIHSAHPVQISSRSDYCITLS